MSNVWETMLVEALGSQHAGVNPDELNEKVEKLWAAIKPLIVMFIIDFLKKNQGTSSVLDSVVSNASPTTVSPGLPEVYQERKEYTGELLEKPTVASSSMVLTEALAELPVAMKATEESTMNAALALVEMQESRGGSQEHMEIVDVAVLVPPSKTAQATTATPTDTLTPSFSSQGTSPLASIKSSPSSSEDWSGSPDFVEQLASFNQESMPSAVAYSTMPSFIDQNSSREDLSTLPQKDASFVAAGSPFAGSPTTFKGLPENDISPAPVSSPVCSSAPAMITRIGSPIPAKSRVAMKHKKRSIAKRNAPKKLGKYPFDEHTSPENMDPIDSPYKWYRARIAEIMWKLQTDVKRVSRDHPAIKRVMLVLERTGEDCAGLEVSKCWQKMMPYVCDPEHKPLSALDKMCRKLYSDLVRLYNDIEKSNLNIPSLSSSLIERKNNEEEVEDEEEEEDEDDDKEEVERKQEEEKEEKGEDNEKKEEAKKEKKEQKEQKEGKGERDEEEKNEEQDEVVETGSFAALSFEEPTSSSQGECEETDDTELECGEGTGFVCRAKELLTDNVYDEPLHWIGCDYCGNDPIGFFHCICLGFGNTDQSHLKEYKCHRCEAENRTNKIPQSGEDKDGETEKEERHDEEEEEEEDKGKVEEEVMNKVVKNKNGKRPAKGGKATGARQAKRLKRTNETNETEADVDPNTKWILLNTKKLNLAFDAFLRQIGDTRSNIVIETDEDWVKIHIDDYKHFIDRRRTKETESEQ